MIPAAGQRAETPRLLLQRAAVGNLLQQHFSLLIIESDLQRLPPGIHGKLRPNLPIGDGRPLLLYADTAFLCRILRRRQGHAPLFDLAQKRRPHPKAVRTPGRYHHALPVLPEKQAAVLLFKIMQHVCFLL